jgi:hypothetical protein
MGRGPLSDTPTTFEEIGRVPQVRQSVPGPKMVFSNAFTQRQPNPDPDTEALVGASPVFIGPGTLWRTWGTRPLPVHSARAQTAHVRKRVHAGLPMDLYLPVNVNRPVFRSTRKDAILSLRWLHAYKKDPPGSIWMCLG